MSLIRTVAFVTSVFLGLSAAVAQQATNNAAASASSTLTNPPVFQGLMVDAKGKTVGRLLTQFIPFTDIPNPTPSYVVRQISGIWVVLLVPNFATGFQTTDATNTQYLYQSIDCTGQAYFAVNPHNETQGMSQIVTGPAVGFVTAIPPATAPSVYFAGSPVIATIQSFRNVGSPCELWGSVPNPNYVGPVQIVPVSSLGLTLPFSIK